MNDAEILEGLKRRDASAVQTLVDLFGDRLLRAAYVLGGNETEARDLVQETLLRAIRSAHRCRGRSSLYTWLHGILRNVNRSRYRKRRRLLYTDTVPEQPVPSSAATDLDAEAAAIILNDALMQLSANHREVLVLRYYEGLSIKEIARCVHANTGTVKSRLFYATRKLRELVPEELNLLGSGDT